ncbi:MAG TPA: phospholipase D-like domain-containing protein, partial [bacterium]
MFGVFGWPMDSWDIVLTLLAVGLDTAVSAHVLLHKRDARSAVSWIGLIWLAPPLLGSILYWIFGINRIQRKAQRLIRDNPAMAAAALATLAKHEHAPGHPGDLDGLVKSGSRLNRRQLLAGNRVTPLENGDAAYPAMLAAIAGARRSVTLGTYLFDNDAVGREFVAALAAAKTRGVAVRVLVDDIGARYSIPPVFHRLDRAGIPNAGFLPTRLPWQAGFLNLRNHRKVMVVDGTTAFTGGMNIRRGHWLARADKQPVQDVQFAISGPVVSGLQEIFATDWEFTTGERLEGDLWFPPCPPTGDVLARAVPDGPEKESALIHSLLMAALNAAEESVLIATPYFIPDGPLVAALNMAAVRGIAVEILLPARGNLPWVQWASQAMLWQVLDKGCRIWLTPPPFDHSKLMVVDERWTMLGSANWDARSLRLNFELNMECYDTPLARAVTAIIRRKQAAAR